MKQAALGRRIVRAAMLLALGCLTGCRDRPLLQVRIMDCYTETRLSAWQGITVRQALEEAEIKVLENDTVSPELDVPLSEDGSKISIGRRANVKVSEDGKSQSFVLTGKKVADAISAAGITLGTYDEVNHDPDAYLSDGMDIQVVHRYAVEIDVDGRKVECLTKADTIEGMLKEQGIHLDKKDQIAPPLGTKLHNGTKVEIHRVFVEQVVEREPIPYDTETEYSGRMYEGETAHRQKGEDGEKELIYEVTYVDGKEESRMLIREETIKEPVSSILVKGTKKRRRVISKEQIFDCDGSGHGYYIITWSDGVVEYQDF